MLRRFMLGLLLCVGLATTARADEQVYDAVVRSTVRIEYLFRKEGDPDRIWAKLGSGVLVDGDRRIVATARHVVRLPEGATPLEMHVRFVEFDADGAPITDVAHYDGSPSGELAGELLQVENEGDVALLRVPSLPESARAIALAASRPRVGSRVHVIGHGNANLGGLFGYSDGAVRNFYKSPVGEIVETSVPTNQGDSGGPVVNDSGELVGLVSNGTTGAALPEESELHAKQIVDRAASVNLVKDLLAKVDSTNAGFGSSPGDSNVRSLFESDWEAALRRINESHPPALGPNGASPFRRQDDPFGLNPEPTPPLAPNPFESILRPSGSVLDPGGIPPWALNPDPPATLNPRP